MKTYGTIFIILLFLVLLGVGIFALNKQVSLEGNAASRCPVPQIPEKNICTEGTNMVLVENSSGCYDFSCR